MVITGTRTGLGRMLASHYAANGFRVIGCSRGPFDGTLHNYEHVEADVGNEAAVRELFSRVRANGRLDVLINNAGVASANHALLTPVETVRATLDTTVVGTFLCCREAAKLMRVGGGRIVNLSSVHVPLASVGTATYGAAKSAVEQFTRVLAKEVAPFGIAVNCLGLPLVRGTGMAKQAHADAVAAMSARLAVPEIDVSDVLEALESLIRGDCRSLTGETVYLGGI